jgi:phosphatidylinositol 3-kinase
MWTEVDTDDALELLGPGTVDSRVRAFAVRQLNRADDEVRHFSYPCDSGTDDLYRSFSCISYNSYKRSSLKVPLASSARVDRQQVQYLMTTAD